MATFRKNSRQEWVVFGTVSEVKPGKVCVEKKGGGVNFVEVESVGKPFDVKGQKMVYGYIAARKAPKTMAQVATVEVDDEAAAEIAAERMAEQAAERAAEIAVNNYYDSSAVSDMF